MSVVPCSKCIPIRKQYQDSPGLSLIFSFNSAILFVKEDHHLARPMRDLCRECAAGCSYTNPGTQGQIMRNLPKADIACLIVVLIWGSNISVVKDGVSQMDPFCFNSLRMALASLVLLSIVLFHERHRLPSLSSLKSLVLPGILGNTLYQMFFIVGISQTKAGNAALLISTTTMFTALFSRLAGHESLSLSRMAGMSVCMAGVAVVILDKPGSFLQSGSLRGDILILCSSVCWAIYTVRSKSIMRAYSSLSFAAVTLSIGAAGFILLSARRLLIQDWNAVPSSAYVEMAYSALFGLSGAYLLFFFAVRHLGSTRTSLYTNLVPFAGLLFAGLFLGEAVTVVQIGGGLLIVLGIYSARRS